MRPISPEVKSQASASTHNLWTWLALVLSLAALNGSLYLTLGMGLRACPLCLFQQTFIMGIAAILVVGLLSGVHRPGSLSLLALPLALGGTILAGLQVFLEKIGVVACPPGILELGSVPEQSVTIQAILLTVLLIDVLRQPSPVFATIGSLFLGVGLAFIAAKSAPASPIVPAGSETPADQDGCRRVK